MSDITAVLPTLLAFFFGFLLLAYLSYQVTIQLQLLVYYSTGSRDMPIIILFLILFPGVLIHETAHWATARLLGLKTSKFRVWPKKSGKHIGMGSVNVERGGTLLDSLVGMAPLIVGTFLIAIIGHRVFNAYLISDALVIGRWQEGLRAMWIALNKPDSAIWAYLLFAIGNSMVPSTSDREPVKPLLLYIAIAALLYVIIGLPLSPLGSILDWLQPLLVDLSSAIFFIILIDLIIIAVLLMLRVFVEPPKGNAKTSKKHRR